MAKLLDTFCHSGRTREESGLTMTTDDWSLRRIRSSYSHPLSQLGRVTALIILMTLSSICVAQTTQPSASTDPKTLEFRASEAFNRNEYAVALPLLQKLEQQMKDQPDKLGPVEEQIRVCQKSIAMAQAAVPVAPGTDQVEMSPEKRKPHPAPKAGEVAAMTIKELGNFEYDADKGGNIPADVKALNGATIRLNGFMIPMDQATNISQFALVPSLFACCFGQPPQIQHTIIVDCPKGKSVSYFPDEINVEGKLKVEEKKEDGFIVSIFEMECLSVKPVAK
jgi:hypothetical protein